jgi:hypothetical protein
MNEKSSKETDVMRKNGNVRNKKLKPNKKIERQVLQINWMMQKKDYQGLTINSMKYYIQTTIKKKIK